MKNMRILQVWRDGTSLQEVILQIEGINAAKRPSEVIVKRNRRDYRLVGVRALFEAQAQGKRILRDVEQPSRVPVISRWRKLARKTHLFGLGGDALKTHMATHSEAPQGFVPISKRAGVLL